MTGRDDLLRAIDRLAAAAEARDLERVRRRHADARALAIHLLPAAVTPSTPVDCPHCGIRCASPARLDEHRHNVHGAPEPEHWRTAAETEQDGRGRHATRDRGHDA